MDSLSAPLSFFPLLYLDGAEEEEEEEEECRSPGGEGAAQAGGRRSIDVDAAERKHYLCHRSRRVYGGGGGGFGERGAFKHHKQAPVAPRNSLTYSAPPRQPGPITFAPISRGRRLQKKSH